MRRKWAPHWKLMLVLAALVAGHQTGFGAELSSPGWMERALELQQAEDRSALGVAGASARAGEIIRAFDESAAASGALLCASPRSRRAAVLFVLSGADPDPARACLTAAGLSDAEKTLFGGAVAYAEGRSELARKLLKNVDPFTLSPMLGGQLALVLAGIVGQEDRAIGIHLLDEARLLGTGGLVEEAALRQEIFLLGGSGDTDKFALVARQYMERFPKSAYAANFFEGFVLGVTKLGLAADDARFASLRKVVDRLESSSAVSVYLLLARHALLTGDFDAVQRAVAAAREETAITPPDRRRADLYSAAAGIFGPQWRASTAALDGLAGKDLDPRDILLRDAAITLAARVREAAHPAHEPSDFKPSVAMAAADTALGAANRLLDSP